MDPEIEKRILARAVEEHLIQIRILLEKGILDEVAVREFEAEFIEEQQKFSSSDSLAVEGSIGSSKNQLILSKNSLDYAAGFDTKSYQILEFLGEGGMAQVFKAYDPVLKRHVALKFLRVGDANWRERFLREAKAQARIEHPNVCKVYEVGEIEERPCIAMQYIEGKTLKQIASSLNVEQKVRLIKEIAEALQEAHRMGVIHRDIKPNNILIHTQENGQIIPYLVDFGLVRLETETEGTTVTDVMIGTPSYMSPEQANGKPGMIDRRTDIYSLGVTIYELLSESLPYSEGDGSISRKILEDDPIPLRKKNRLVPSDLETIIMKCLEKQPERRYDSAKAFAEDLQRYIDGEPVFARHSSLTYKLFKKGRKNKKIVAVAAVAFLLVCFFGWLGIKSRQTAQKQLALAQRFGEKVNQIESVMRFAHMLPLHDTTAEKEVAKQSMRQIADEMKTLGKIATALGTYALGRGFFALRDYSKAQENLQRAWNEGYRTPEAAYALGQTFTALYQQKLGELRRIADKDLRVSQRREIEKQFREPARFYLYFSHDVQVESKIYVEGLLAFVEKKLDEALVKSKQAYQQKGWFYEAKRLEADIYVEFGNQESERGQYERAKQNYQKADQAYRHAIQIGRSDSSIYKGLCNSNVSAILMELESSGNPLTHLDDGLLACQQALQADPADVEAHNVLSDFYYWVAEHERRNGAEPRLNLTKSRATAQKALTLLPTAEAYVRISSAYWSEAFYEDSQGQDPRSNLQNSINAVQKALEINPNSEESFNLMGVANNLQASYETAHALNPDASLQKAIDAFQKAIRINPNFGKAYTNLGTAYSKHLHYELVHGLDIRKGAYLAIEAYEKALRINPNSARTISNVGNTYMMLGVYELEHGGDPRQSLRKAIEAYEKAQIISPTLPFGYNNMASVLGPIASYKLSQGLDPTIDLQNAIENCEKALQLRPNYANAYINLGTSYRYFAEYDLSQKKDPMDSFKKAVVALQKALELSPDNVEAIHEMGRSAVAEGHWLMIQGKDPQDAFFRARKMFDRALKINSQDADALLGLGRLYRWRAEWRLEKRQSPSEEVSQGLLPLNKMLSFFPNSSHIYATQGMLYLIESKAKKNLLEKSELLKKAYTSIEKAISFNQNLAHEYAPYLRKARELSTNL